MSKGIIRFANVSGAGVHYNTRELSTETGSTLSVYLDEGRVDLARSDLDNVPSNVVRNKIATELDYLGNTVDDLTQQVNYGQELANTKKDRALGLIKDYPANLLTVVSRQDEESGQVKFGIKISSFSYFNGTSMASFAGEDFIELETAYAGQVVYIGLSKDGVALAATSSWDIPILLGSIYVDNNYEVTSAELSVTPYLAENSLFGRDHPVMVNGLDITVSNKIVKSTSYDIIKEGINYTNELHPNKKLFPQMSQVNFKYYYPNWNFNEEQINTEINAANYYNTSTAKKVTLPVENGTSKFVVYRGVLIETGQILMLLQQVASENELFNSVAEAELNLENLKWDLTGLSSRAIYLNEFIVASADLSIIKEAKAAQTANTQNIINNLFCYGYAPKHSNEVSTVEQFRAIFNQDPQVGGCWFGLVDANEMYPQSTRVNIITAVSDVISYDYADNLSLATANNLSDLIVHYCSKIVNYNGYFNMANIGDTEELNWNMLTVEGNDNDFFGKAYGYLVFDSHGAIAQALSTNGTDKVTVKLIRNINSSNVQPVSIIQRTEDTVLSINASSNKNMFYIICKNNTSADGMLYIHPVISNDVTGHNQFTIEATIDLGNLDINQLRTIKLVDSNGTTLNPIWVDGSGGAIPQLDMVGLVIRRTLSYNSTKDTYNDLWLANFTWSGNKIVEVNPGGGEVNPGGGEQAW